ncbi:unnamed protein product [Clonostachys rosea]|uniref:Uncharacterized protein n=1 Tax=Bionectria ochroleuca TaxID=29856 RepID=A0ABY6US56_BIOOC|nr:unnamed protein product [Clonostachys rosea]
MICIKQQLPVAASLMFILSEHFVVAKSTASHGLDKRNEINSGNLDHLHEARGEPDSVTGGIAQVRNVQQRGLSDDNFVEVAFTKRNALEEHPSHHQGGRRRKRKSVMSRSNGFSRMHISESMSETICRPGEKCKTQKWSSCKEGDGSGDMHNCEKRASKGRRIGSGHRRKEKSNRD